MNINHKYVFEYNNNNDLIKKTSISYGYLAGSSSSNCSHEYYPNGLLKKSTLYGYDKQGHKIVGEIVEYKSFDNSNNWTEKVILSDLNVDREWRPYKKYVREIEYY